MSVESLTHKDAEPSWEAPVGWIAPLAQALVWIDENAPGSRVRQVKQDMGQLDVVFEHPDEASDQAVRAHDSVRQIVDRAARLCTVCGQPGASVQDQQRFWLDVRCQDHPLGEVEPTSIRFTTL